MRAARNVRRRREVRSAWERVMTGGRWKGREDKTHTKPCLLRPSTADPGPQNLTPRTPHPDRPSGSQALVPRCMQPAPGEALARPNPQIPQTHMGAGYHSEGRQSALEEEGERRRSIPALRGVTRFWKRAMPRSVCRDVCASKDRCGHQRGLCVWSKLRVRRGREKGRGMKEAWCKDQPACQKERAGKCHGAVGQAAQARLSARLLSTREQARTRTRTHAHINARTRTHSLTHARTHARTHLGAARNMCGERRAELDERKIRQIDHEACGQ